MWSRGRAGIYLAAGWLLLMTSSMPLASGPACGLRHRAGGRTPCAEASPGPGSQRFETLLAEACALGWAPSGQIEVAEDVQGMTEFVDGAAELLWEKGVRNLAVQSYVGPEAGDSAEAFRYEFTAQDLSLDFWKENCPEPALKSRSDGRGSLSCERSDASLSQAFFWRGRVVLEVRLYGDAADREALVRLLDAVFEDPAGVADGQGRFSP